MRSIIISDLYGETGALSGVLAAAGFDRKQDTLVFLGNLMDLGPDPFGAYRMVRDLKTEMENRLVLLCGDHERMFIDSELLTRGQLANGLIWRQNGGKETVDAFKKRGVSTGKAAVWLKENLRTWYEDLDFIAVHGDIRDDIIWNNSEDNFVWGNQGVLYNDYSGKLAVVGNAPVKAPTYLDGSGNPFRPELRYGVWYSLPKNGMIALNTGLDTPGKLTAMIIENRNMYFLSP